MKKSDVFLTVLTVLLVVFLLLILRIFIRWPDAYRFDDLTFFKNLLYGYTGIVCACYFAVLTKRVKTPAKHIFGAVAASVVLTALLFSENMAMLYTSSIAEHAGTGYHLPLAMAVKSVFNLDALKFIVFFFCEFLVCGMIIAYKFTRLGNTISNYFAEIFSPYEYIVTDEMIDLDIDAAVLSITITNSAGEIQEIVLENGSILNIIGEYKGSPLKISLKRS